MRTNVDGCSLRLWTLIPAPDLGLNPVCQTTVGGLGHRKNLGTVPHAGGCLPSLRPEYVWLCAFVWERRS